jgi:hypothetical protein
MSQRALFGSTALISVLLLAVSGGPATAANFSVGPGVTDTAAKTLGTGSGQTGSVAATGTLSVSGSTNAVTISGNNATLTNLGTIKQTGTGRAIRDNTGVSNLNITNGSTTNSTALIQTNSADVIQMNVGNASVTLNNYGTMESLNTGGGGNQAIDFAAITNGSNIVNNYAGGLLKATNADAVRPGANGVINNYGTITAIDTSNDPGADGVDMQGNSATVNNYAGGAITGGRHGITSDVNVIVNNAAGASITGSNGSGVGSDGTGTVVNYGTITGQTAPGKVYGDGDGVDIDGLANVQNYGTIRGTGSYGTKPGDAAPSQSEGLALGGGSILNVAGALISGGNNGILVDDSNGGGAPNATTITNAGTIEGLNGYGIKFIGTQNDTITNTGTITATSGAAVDMGGGNDTLNLQTGSAISGGIDGGSGNDTLHLSGTGSLGSTANFEALQVEGGTWTLTGNQHYVSGNVFNNGVLKTDPTTITFTDLTIATTGALQGEAGDVYQIDGDLLNHSAQSSVWDTSAANLEFVAGADHNHTLLLTGTDVGASAAGKVNNFFWNALTLGTDENLSLGNGVGSGTVALYVGLVTGFDILGSVVQNVTGNGFNIYYDALLNSGLQGLTYNLANGGFLMAYESGVPAPGALALLGLGLLGLRMVRRKAS